MSLTGWLADGTEGFNTVEESLEDEASDRLNVPGREPDEAAFYVMMDGEVVPLVSIEGSMTAVGSELEERINSEGVVVGRRESYDFEMEDAEGYQVGSSGSIRVERPISQDINLPYSDELSALYNDLSGVRVVLSDLEGEGPTLFDAVKNFAPSLTIRCVPGKDPEEYEEKEDPALAAKFEWRGSTGEWEYTGAIPVNNLHGDYEPETATEIIGNGAEGIANSRL